MSFFKKLANLFSASNGTAQNAYWLAVRCNRCGETIEGRVNLNNDLSIDYGDNPNKPSYFCRKVLMGDQQCFQQIEVELTFDEKKNLKERQVRGGQFID